MEEKIGWFTQGLFRHRCVRTAFASLSSSLIYIDEKGDNITVYLVYADGTRASQPLLVIQSANFNAEFAIKTSVPNLEKLDQEVKRVDPFLKNPIPSMPTTLTYDLRPFEATMANTDAFMINAEVGGAFGGGVAGGLSAVLINKGEDQGIHFYRNFGVRLGLDGGAGVVGGPIDFNENNSANQTLYRGTFTGWSQGMNDGVGEVSGTTVTSYVGGDLCVPFVGDCEPLYNGVLVGVSTGPTEAGASYYFSRSSYLGSCDAQPAQEQPATKTDER